MQNENPSHPRPNFQTGWRERRHRPGHRSIFARCDYGSPFGQFFLFRTKNGLCRVPWPAQRQTLQRRVREEAVAFIGIERLSTVNSGSSANLVAFSIGANNRVSGGLTNTDNVTNSTFWIGVQPSLKLEMLEFTAHEIETYLGVIF
jgi:hypothetical protein